MKKLGLSVLTIFLCFVMSDLHAQTKNWALGFQIGEPTAVSVRKYGDKNAFDVGFGTYTGLLKKKDEYRSGEYASIGMMFNGSYLWYVPMANEKIMGYGGLGAQLNIRRYYADPSNKDVHERTVSTGPSVKLGLEFFSKNGPGSFFIEGGGYLELIPKVFYFNPNLSIGLRHNF